MSQCLRRSANLLEELKEQKPISMAYHIIPSSGDEERPDQRLPRRDEVGVQYFVPSLGIFLLKFAKSKIYYWKRRKGLLLLVIDWDLDF